MMMQNLLHRKAIFTAKEDGLYVMEIDDRFFNINEEVKKVVEILAQSSNYTQACTLYNIATNELHSEDDFKIYSEQILESFNFEKKKKSFLLVEKIILSPKIAGQLVKPFEWLFSPLFFWISFSSLILFSIYLTFFLEKQSSSYSIPVFTFFISYMVSIVLHEFGHLAACKRFTGKNGGMGVGVYLIYPVFFSNISSIWHATKGQKVIANLAGVYMQLWVVVFFAIMYVFTDHQFFLEFSLILILLCFIQLLPFIRSDGYWLLNDIFGIDNLMDKSSKKVLEFLKNPFSFFNKKILSHYGLFLYGIINVLFVVSFAYFQIRYNLSAVVNLPKYIWGIFLQLLSGSFNEIKFDSIYFPVILLYYIAYNYLKKLILKLAKKN